ncbi:uncharacterized protein LOC107857538 isoform X2 [Capsicum annuum]|uniref:uncharacterized protein LOC107857538 isoform X2 n=1 Tax=Capsicum annuum TaxID=4072 RepID=UPI001FB197C4|nr:uncharacterized protein LOC107857538 isoform X2 [Capsicum annuum]
MESKITSYLVNVCEECGDLLINARRKYRLALSINGNDVRALYNWGISLPLRGQLIADIGPVTSMSMNSISSMEKLEHLAMVGYGIVDDEGLHYLGKGCPSLQQVQ